MTYDCTIDLSTAIDWQRGSSEKLSRLLELKQEWYTANYCDFWNNWVVDVFDLRTANEFGLSVWSIILDLPLFDRSERSRDDYPVFLFGSTRQNFSNGNFGTNGANVDALTVDQKRIMLQLKAFILNMRSSTYEINLKLADLFGSGEIYAIDNLNMTYTYVVNNANLTSFISVLIDYDLLPRPNSVSVTVQ